MPIWSLALSFSLAQIFQAVTLSFILNRKIDKFPLKEMVLSFGKVVAASGVSGLLMFFFLKVLDRSVWDKNLSFLSFFGLKMPTTFDHLVLDTRYTLNVVLLSTVVGLIGLSSYFLVSWLLGIKEGAVFFRMILKMKSLGLSKRKIIQEEESLSL